MDIAIKQKVLIYWAILTTLVSCAACGAWIDRLPSYAECETEPVAPRRIELGEGHWELWQGFLEITKHCLYHDEILECVEFPHASKLSLEDCRLATDLAELVCTVIGAPIEKESALGWTLNMLVGSAN